MIVRLIAHGHETWHYDVTHVECDKRRYLSLTLTSYPHHRLYWLGENNFGRSWTSVLLCADADEVVKALRAEHPEKDYSNYCTCLSISRDPLCVWHGDVDKVKRLHET